MSVFANDEIPLWLFITFVAVLCLLLSAYLTYRRDRAAGQTIAGQRQRLPRQKALVLGTASRPRLTLLTFCPACGKPANTSAGTDTCEFCGQTIVSVSRRTINRKENTKIVIRG